ncbi:hypothetical protein DV711_11350 [Motiliproteus coralliicola]|uniref:Uncharacterized protein n=1 Tax=Motiliproteus coralliicola TaxID=2283196 RepID=A0A369WBU0_9GAMM|nr:hypothetical protein DV711_11350 [Motiliproteus coralliicola]
MEAPSAKGNIGLAAKIFTGFITLLLVLEAIAASVSVPKYESIFTGFGAKLPFFTEVIVASTFWIWLLPLAALGIIYQRMPKGKSYVLPVLFIFVLGVLYVPAALYGLYLPVWELAEAQA